MCDYVNINSTSLVSSQGTFLVTQAVSKALVSAGAQKGSIITVGSIVGKVKPLQRAIHHHNNIFLELELCIFFICL